MMRKKIRNAITEMVIEDEMPFVFMDGTGFKKFMKVVKPRFNIPSHFTMMKDCVKMYLRTKINLKNMFTTNNQRVYLTINTWTSIQNMNYMYVTAILLTINGHCIENCCHSVKYQIIRTSQLGEH
jgi:hypothetical protein